MPMPSIFHSSGGPSVGHLSSRPTSWHSASRFGPCHCGQSPAVAAGRTGPMEAPTTPVASTESRQVRKRPGMKFSGERVLFRGGGCDTFTVVQAPHHRKPFVTPPSQVRNTAMPRSFRRAAVFLSLILACGSALAAPDSFTWPQWQGPDRTSVSKETGLLQEWPKGGPKLLWTATNLGDGYSGPAVVGERLYTLGMRGDVEYVLCYSTADGKELWAVKNGPAYHNDFGDGPRSTPTVEGEWLYALGANGDLC